MFWLGTKPKKTDKTVVHVSLSIPDLKITPLYFWKDAGCSVPIKKSNIDGETCIRKIGAFFIRFVLFTSTLVYSVIWNQYLVKVDVAHGWCCNCNT